jgi:hypothetical protein
MVNAMLQQSSRVDDEHFSRWLGEYAAAVRSVIDQPLTCAALSTPSAPQSAYWLAALAPSTTSALSMALASEVSGQMSDDRTALGDQAASLKAKLRQDLGDDLVAAYLDPARRLSMASGDICSVSIAFLDAIAALPRDNRAGVWRSFQGVVALADEEDADHGKRSRSRRTH